LSNDNANPLLTSQPPGFPAGEACAIALARYDRKATASPLWSERDQNFRLRCTDGQQFVLKIANTLESPDVIDLQTRALEHIASTDPGLPVPRTIPDNDGRDYCLVPDEQGREHMVRLITWLDGRIIEESGISAELLEESGGTLARLGLALKGFSHPAASHHLLWDLKNAAELLDLLPHIERPGLRKRLENALRQFIDRVHPVIGSLRTQIIHADLNRGNILISKDLPERVTGIIDFGDMVRTPLIMDLAIAAAYHLSDSGDPLEMALNFISGYHVVAPLEKVEADILFDLMLARLCTSITVQMWRAKLYPENSEYLLIHNHQVRSTLEYVSSCSADECRRRIRELCGYS
jgi:Ser/Thr protein kinase RdoA (MazF antagonist)